MKYKVAFAFFIALLLVAGWGLSSTLYWYRPMTVVPIRWIREDKPLSFNSDSYGILTQADRERLAALELRGSLFADQIANLHDAETPRILFVMHSQITKEVRLPVPREDVIYLQTGDGWQVIPSNIQVVKDYEFILTPIIDSEANINATEIRVTRPDNSGGWDGVAGVGWNN